MRARDGRVRDGRMGHAPVARRWAQRFARCSGAAVVLAAALHSLGCVSTTEADLRHEITVLREDVKERDNRIAAQQAAMAEVNRQLQVARGLTDEDFKKIFYPEKLVIDRLSGGADYDNKPGDDGVTVYLRPVDKEGDGIKVAGDITIQLYDLAAPPEQNLVGEYKVPVEQAINLWHGKFLTNHFTIKCPWPPSRAPKHPEVTVRAIFVDYLTKRVLSAQSVVTVHVAAEK